MLNEQQDRRLSPEDIAADNARVQSKPLPVLPPKPTFREPPRTFKRIHEALPPIPHGDATTEPEAKRCPKCQGGGFYTLDVPLDDPRFSKAQICDAPNCPHVKRDKQSRTAVFLERMTRHFGGTPEYYQEATLEDLNNPALRKNPVAVDAARLFIERKPLVINGIDKYSLVFTGAPAAGKTYLASIIRNELAGRGELVWFNTVRTMLKAVQSGYSYDTDMKDTAVEDALCNAPFLFIDELEINKRSDDKIDILEAVVNRRMLAKMPTVITTNIDQRRVGDVWNWRIGSRLTHVAWWINMGDQGLRDKSGEISGGER